MRLANLKSGSLDLIERALATDLKEIRADPKLKLATQIEIGYQGLTLNLANGEAGKNGPFGKDPRVRQALEAAIDRKALSDVVFNGEVLPGNQWVSPKSPYFQQKFPVPGPRRRQGQEAAGRRRRDHARRPSTSWCRTIPESRQVAEVIQAMAGGSGLRHEDPRHRVRHLAQGSRAGPLPGLLHRLVAAASIPTATATSSTSATRRRTTGTTATRTSISGSTMLAQGVASSRSARRSTRRSRTSTSRRDRSSTSITGW